MLSRLRITLLALATVLGVVLALPTTAQAAAGKPRAGQCHQLTLRQLNAISDTKKAVSCGGRHNVLTIAVVTAPASLAGLSADEKAVLATRLCTKPQIRALGRNAVRRAASAYTGFVFVPTAKQIAQGARWVRCDLALQTGRTFASLPKGLHRPILPRRATEATLRCLTKAGYTTPCAKAHAYRPSKAFTFDPIPYPSHDAFVATAQKVCPSGFGYATWTGEFEWNAGDRVLICYKTTTR